ncbi:MAG: DUF4355 domain-containing protein [Firmicutes bacterium]|jgi:hypothetical protein|nr:DUF4355 domain-containing protein [Bacillota bacterium]
MKHLIGPYGNWRPLMDKEGTGGGETPPADPQAKPKTYTDAEFQAEVDRRVTSAMKKAEKKSQEKVREAEKLAKMDADEKLRYELEQREKVIEQKEQELALAENKAECGKILASKGISADLVDFVVDVDADTMRANINSLHKAFMASVKAEVEKRLASNSPKGGAGFSEGMTKEKFRQLSINERQRLYNESPELYKQMTT